MMDDAIDAYPLTWPVTWPRTKNWHRKLSQFADRSLAKARDFVLDELRLLKARDVVISTNVALRRDGLPRSGRSRPDDPGAAVYFNLGGEPRVLACDKWTLVEDNLWAIGLHIESMRGQQRWGVGTLDQAFAGYAALPAPSPFYDQMLQSLRVSSPEAAQATYRELVKKHHPDAGGNHEDFLQVQRAWEQVTRERGWK